MVASYIFEDIFVSVQIYDFYPHDQPDLHTVDISFPF